MRALNACNGFAGLLLQAKRLGVGVMHALLEGAVAFAGDCGSCSSALLQASDSGARDANRRRSCRALAAVVAIEQQHADAGRDQQRRQRVVFHLGAELLGEVAGLALGQAHDFVEHLAR